ncbi:MAG TPA: glutathione peroxidase [Paracoccaceae bacterium]|nr:glutathione peroxidase [Paracoccaceae bacterium]
MRLSAVAALAAVLSFGAPAAAAPPPAPFASIDGGMLSMADYAGRPVLLVNTASLCGYTPQYDALQALWDTYRDKGLVVLAVPSNDFRQELASADVVREFCAVNFDLTLPMTDITPVRGPQAHPVYAWVLAEAGWEPRWNFNKVLIDRKGRVAGTWGSGTDPMGRTIRRAVEAALAGG